MMACLDREQQLQSSAPPAEDVALPALNCRVCEGLYPGTQAVRREKPQLLTWSVPSASYHPPFYTAPNVLKHPRATWSYLHGLLLQPDCRDADADAARGATEGARAQSARVLERAWHVVLGATPRLPRRTQRKELPKKLRWVDVENRQNPEGPEPNRGREEL